MGKVSAEIVFLLVVVPLSMYTCFLLLGIRFGRLLEREADITGGVEILMEGAGLRALQPPKGVIRRPWGGSSDGQPSFYKRGTSGGFRGQPFYMRGGASGGSGGQPSTFYMRRGASHPPLQAKGVTSVGLWGGSGGQPFYMRGGGATRLRRIVLYHSGAIHALACDYLLPGDVEVPRGWSTSLPRVAGPWGQPDSYGSIGVRTEIELRSGEHITAVEGTTGHFANVVGVVITSLTFRTSSGRTYGPYGSKVTARSNYFSDSSRWHYFSDGARPHHFSVPVANGACIVGFWGRSGWLLDAIGVYMKPSCTSSSSSSDTAAYNYQLPSGDAYLASSNKYASRRQGPN